MKNVFIDCGTHFGEGLHEFEKVLKFDPSNWEIFTFEANPDTYQTFLAKNPDLITRYNIKHFNKAVYDHEGTITFHQQTNPDWNEPKMGGGSSLMPLDRWNPHNGTKRGHFITSVAVECFNLSDFIRQFKGRDIFIKLDIEGAEFAVLEKMIDDRSIDLVKTIYIEFHDSADFFEESYVEVYKQKKDRITKYCLDHGIELVTWWI